MSNYHLFSTIDDIEWPEYVSSRNITDDKSQKAAHVLDMALVTLEAYGGPSYQIVNINRAIRQCIYLYEINADLVDSDDEVNECNILILYEPWMKANCIAQAAFEFANDDVNTKIVIRRKKNVHYYKNDELSYENDIAISQPSHIPKVFIQHTSV